MAFEREEAAYRDDVGWEPRRASAVGAHDASSAVPVGEDHLRALEGEVSRLRGAEAEARALRAELADARELLEAYAQRYGPL